MLPFIQNLKCQTENVCTFQVIYQNQIVVKFWRALNLCTGVLQVDDAVRNRIVKKSSPSRFGSVARERT